jgi:hypothetical protein
MARLFNVRERIDDVLVFQTPDEKPLAPLGEEQGECDDGFCIFSVASPPDKIAEPGELLRIAVVVAARDKVMMAWPIDDLHKRWKRGIDASTVAALLAAYDDNRRERKLLLRWLTEPGVALESGIVVPPGSRVRVDTTGGTSVTAYLRGLRSREVT